MKAFFLGSCLLLLTSLSIAQSGTWVWMNGSDTADSQGAYGTIGIPSTNNSPPAAYQAVQWTDKQGNFWIYYNGLWKYDPSANTWACVRLDSSAPLQGVYGIQGVPSPTNSPGWRVLGSTSWTDTIGDLWLFGGEGWDYTNNQGVRNDLWRYNIASNQWTWMLGPALVSQLGNYGNLGQSASLNLPPARAECNTAWTYKNDLWLFGGESDRAPCYNDIWRYTMSNNQWTWMGGGKDTNTLSNYGIRGTENSSNLPPTRASYMHGIGPFYDLYISGGCNFRTYNYFNDVWRFNLITKNWTWVAGDSTYQSLGYYGGQCANDSANVPWARFESRSAELSGCNHLLFLFGGWDPAPGNWRSMNDLWCFCPETNIWNWVSGPQFANNLGFYGIKGVLNPSNLPPARAGHCFWSDKAGNIWLFGGMYDDGNGSFSFNDMWKFIPDTLCMAFKQGKSSIQYQLSVNSICPGDSAIISFNGNSAISISPKATVMWLDISHALLKPDSSTVYTLTGYSSCGNYDSLNFILQVLSGTISLTSDKSFICANDSAYICAISGYNSYSWNTGDTTACINAKFQGNYIVTVSDNGQCSAVSNAFYLSVHNPAPVTVSANGDSLSGYNADNYQWLLNGIPITGATSSVYVAHASGSYTLQVTDSNGCIATSTPVYITSLRNELPENSITIYPNPTSTGWQLTVSPELIGSIAEVFDATGRLIYKSILTALHSPLTIQGAAKGLYELRITSNDYTVVRKLVKM